MITDIIAGFLSGAVGAMGFGGGGVLILYLTIYREIPQLNAQGINLMFFIPSAITALIKHNKNKLIDWKISKTYIFYGLFGTMSGYLLIRILDENIISKIFAVILILIGVKDLFVKNKKSS